MPDGLSRDKKLNLRVKDLLEKDKSLMLSPPMLGWDFQLYWVECFVFPGTGHLSRT